MYLPVLLKVMILLLVMMVLKVLMDDVDDDSFLELINPRLKLDSLPLLDIEYR